MKTRFISCLLVAFMTIGQMPQTATAQTIPAPNWGSLLLSKITETRNGATVSGQFEYDEFGRLTKFSYDAEHEAYYFTYNGSGIELASSGDGYNYEVDGHEDIVNGRLAQGYVGGEIGIKFSVEYNEKGRISKWSGDAGDFTNNVEMIWTGDNITTVNSVRNVGDIQAGFNYDESKTAPLVLQMLIIGELGSPISLNNVGPNLRYFMYCGNLSTNLITSSQRTRKGNTDQCSFAYDYDSDGNIVKMDINGSKSASYQFEWKDNPSYTAGINSIEVDNQRAIYSITGQKLSAPRRGINIIDGKKFFK